MFTSSDSSATEIPNDRVRHATSEQVNQEIDARTDANIAAFRGLDEPAIRRRISELDSEWDVERVLEVNAATLALSGLLLGVTVNKRWLMLPGVVLPFLLQHGLQGWCPPLPVLRRLGIRTRGEIDRERYALARVLDGGSAGSVSASS